MCVRVRVGNFIARGERKPIIITDANVDTTVVTSYALPPNSLAILARLNDRNCCYMQGMQARSPQDMYTYSASPYAYPPPPPPHYRAEESGSTTSMPWWLLVGVGVVVGGLLGKVRERTFA